MTLKDLLWTIPCYAQVHLYIELSDSIKEYEGPAFGLYEELEGLEEDYLSKKVVGIVPHTCDDIFIDLEVSITMEEDGSDI